MASVTHFDHANPEEVNATSNIATRALKPLRTFEADEISSINSSPEHTDRKQRESMTRKSAQASNIEVYDPEGDREDEFRDALKEIAKMGILTMVR